MTATIHQFTPRRKPAPPIPNRSAELAFILAIVDALPADTKAKSLATVREMAERSPSCVAAQGAAHLAEMIEGRA